MKPSLLYNGIAHLFILLFLYTALAKIVDPSALSDQLVSSPMLGNIVGLVTWALPISELLIVVILLMAKWRLIGLYFSLGLMVCFTVYLIAIQHIDANLSCGCGGIIESLSTKQHLIFNLFIIALGTIGIIAGRRNVTSFSVRWLMSILSLVLVATMGWLVFTTSGFPAIKRTGFEGNPLPQFSLLLSDSVTRLNTKEIPEGRPFIVIGFSPYCPYCQGEIKDIIQHIDQFRNTRIYLVTTFPVTDVRKFYNRFQLSQYSNIIVGIDTNNTFLSYFNWHMIPYTAVYDGKKRLAQTIAGRANVLSLLHCVKS